MEAYTNFLAGPSKIETRAAGTALATPIKLRPRIISASKKWYGQNRTGRTACAGLAGNEAIHGNVYKSRLNAQAELVSPFTHGS